MDADGMGKIIEGLITTAFLITFLALMGLMIYRMWIRHVIQHHRAKSEPPKLANELGLRYQPSKQPKEIGSLGARTVATASRSIRMGTSRAPSCRYTCASHPSWC